jgi:hypothetical protein
MPEGKTISKGVMKLSLYAKAKLAIDDAVLLTMDGAIFLSQFRNASDRVVTFKEVKRSNS